MSRGELRGAGNTAVEGNWLIGDPDGMSMTMMRSQPMAGYEGCGCAFTGENPEDCFEDDVDEGVVYWYRQPST
ncbi:MAG: hypothetical protein JSU68_08955 [Phycisphaerales bacterium]|nr:MAG: hypothetical protein JSU68_08955 [Phycisphaerales bacterium]